MKRIHATVLLGVLSMILACASLPARAAEEPAAIDAETAEQWSAPYRGWHYHPDHVIPAKPNIRGFEDVRMTDVPTVFHLPGDKRWYMTFIGFDGKGYQSFVADSDDLVHWSNMRLAMSYGPKGSFDYGGVVLGAYLYAETRPGWIRSTPIRSLSSGTTRTKPTTCSTVPLATRAEALA